MDGVTRTQGRLIDIVVPQHSVIGHNRPCIDIMSAAFAIGNHKVISESYIVDPIICQIDQLSPF